MKKFEQTSFQNAKHISLKYLVNEYASKAAALIFKNKISINHKKSINPLAKAFQSTSFRIEGARKE